MISYYLDSVLKGLADFAVDFFFNAVDIPVQLSVKFLAKHGTSLVLHAVFVVNVNHMLKVLIFTIK